MDIADWPIVAGDDHHLEIVIDGLLAEYVYPWKCQIRRDRDVDSPLLAEAACRQSVNGAGYVVAFVSLTADQTRGLSRAIGSCCHGWYDVQMVDEVGETHTVLGGQLQITKDVTL